MTIGGDRSARSPFSWRVIVHALDRTGPPMLALAVARWLRRTHPADEVEVVAFRGGDMLGEFAQIADAHVLLDDHEVWDHESPPGKRVAELRGRTAGWAPASANLLVSVAAGQSLPLLDCPGPIVTWSVEVGEDLHWLSGPIPLAQSTDRWLAGSNATASELTDRLGTERPKVVPEFVDDPAGVSTERIDEVRRVLGGDEARGVVVGAGIGTVRKGLDLFVEAAAEYDRRWPGEATFTWFGGQADPLWPAVSAEIERLGLPVTLRSSVADLHPYLAAADVFLHPARRDAFPLVCLHASLARTPVVAFDGGGGIGEMFGPTGQLVPYPDLVSAAETVHRLATTETGPDIGARQGDYVRQRFTTDAAAPLLYEHLVAAACGGR